MKTQLYLLLIFSLCSLSIFSQTDKSKIIANTDVKALERFALVQTAKFKASKKAAFKKAISLELDTANLCCVSDLGELLYWVENNSTAAATTNTDAINSGGIAGLALDGDGMLIGIWEAGDGGRVPLTNHENFVTNGTSRVTLMDTTVTTSSHASHVAGTLIGDGSGNATAKGMASKANLNAWGSANDVAEMAIAAANGMLVSNHSYGFGLGWTVCNTCTPARWLWWGGGGTYNSTGEAVDFGRYSSFTKSYDSLAIAAPNYLIVKSAGNERNNNPTANQNVQNGSGGPIQGYNPALHPPGDAFANANNGFDLIGPKAAAKNILTVGAIDAANGNTPAAFTSYGPTDDGRIKPDLVAHGVGLISSGNASTTNYYSSDGTSMSSPNISGSAILLQEHYENLFGIGTFMRAATLKALMIHTATDIGNDGPDYQFGWGILNALDAANILTDATTDQSFVLENTHTGVTPTYGFLSACQDDMRVTMAYADPVGTVQTTLDNTTPNLVNDLDIKLLNIDNSSEFPWVLNPANPAAFATTGDNDLDNVEQIISAPNHSLQFLQVGREGPLTGGTQDYSLIVSNYSDVCTFTVIQNNVTINQDENFCSLTIMNSEATIPNNVEVKYAAGSYVTLKPGFKALGGSSVKAYIADCN